MLETSVQVCFFTETDYFVEMRIVDVSINTEKSLEDILNYITEVLWERNI